jgi:hypothetical protein
LNLPKLTQLRETITKNGKSGDNKAQRDAIAAIEQTATWLSKLPLSIDQQKDRITLSLGFGEGEPIIVGLPNEPRIRNELDKELITYARTLQVPFREGVTVDSLTKEFLKKDRKTP